MAKLTKYIYDSQKDSTTTLTSLAKQVCKELEGSFAFIFKSSHFPNEIVATRRGSPLLIGVKTEKKLKVDFVDVEFGNAADSGKCDLIGQAGNYMVGQRRARRLMMVVITCCV